jgi:hemoglobin-like flavoprotein
MTPDQIVLVKTTWQKVLPIRDTAAELFYTKLFTLDPALKPLFKSDIKEQGRKLTAMISTAVNGLERLDSIVPAVQGLGQRHVAYGVKDGDYDTVAGALIWTLEQGLGEAFTPQVKTAWVDAYTLLATTMKQAASKVDSSRAA